jgi:hypothetical protein
VVAGNSITKDYKLGMIMNPGDALRKFDFCLFGRSVFVRNSASLEIKNHISYTDYRAEFKKIRAYYQNFIQKNLMLENRK